MPIFVRKSLLTSEWFGANYRLAFTWPLPQELWGDREILVYRRR